MEVLEFDFPLPVSEEGDCSLFFLPGFPRSPQFKRQQEKTQQAKRVLELENDIDERNYAIEAQNKEIESLSKTLKVSHGA